MFVASVIGGGIGGLFFLGFFCSTADSRSAAIGLVAGIVAIVWCTLSRFDVIPESVALDIHPFLIIVVGNLTVFVVGVVASSFGRTPGRPEVHDMTWEGVRAPD